MRAIARDYAQQGDALWELFHAKDPKDLLPDELST